MMSEVVLKLLLLSFFQQLINILKINVTRYIIKTVFSTEEIGMASWFRIDFILEILRDPFKIVGLLVIACFTIITFPLGIWVGSFKLGLSTPIATMVSYAMLMLSVPINLFIIRSWQNEISFTSNAFLGVFLVELAQALAIAGWFLILQAQG